VNAGAHRPLSRETPSPTADAKPAQEAGASGRLAFLRTTQETASPPGKILLVDDSPIVLDTISDFLSDMGWTVLTAQNGVEALAATTTPELDLVISDLNMPDMSGIDALDQLGQSHPDIPVVVLSGVDDLESMRAAFDRGAAGFIHKSALSDVLVSAIRLVFSGGVYVPPQLLDPGELGGAGLGARHLSSGGGIPLNMTERQQEVLQLVLQGKTNKEICRTLSLAEPTVKVHVSAILRILGVQSRTQAVLAATRLGLSV